MHSIIKKLTCWFWKCHGEENKMIKRLYPIFKDARVAPHEPASGGANLKDSMRGLFLRKEWTMFIWTPFPFPWMMRTSLNPFFWHSKRYSSKREGISLGEKVWRSIQFSMGIRMGITPKLKTQNNLLPIASNLWPIIYFSPSQRSNETSILLVSLSVCFVGLDGRLRLK